MVFRLDDELWFPNPTLAERGDHDGLVAVGGDLSVERLTLAYRSGIFPWSVDPLTWWSPDPRGIIELDQLRVSRSLRRTLRRAPFTVTRDRAFREVMLACADAHRRDGTWISPEFISAYTSLHRAGRAHSVECWRGETLVGGIYGVQSGAAFAGESMFHIASDASKVALVQLVEHLKRRGFALFDIQMVTPVTAGLGGVSIPRGEYLGRLAEAVERESEF